MHLHRELVLGVMQRIAKKKDFLLKVIHLEAKRLLSENTKGEPAGY
ncbi:MAG: hypothetical protein V7K38_08240 [Nostoc sp.]